MRKVIHWLLAVSMVVFLGIPLLLPQPVYADSVTLYPSADTDIDEAAPTTNRYNYGNLYAGADDDAAYTNGSKAILQFAIAWGSTIPTGSTITSAQLKLYYDGFIGSTLQGEDLVVYRMTRTTWVQSQATWNNYKTGSAWGVAGAGSAGGADYSQHEYGTAVMPAVNNWITIDILAQVQLAQTNAIDVYTLVTSNWMGWAYPGDTRQARFRSVDYTGTTYDPQLVITYTAPTPPIDPPVVSTLSAASIGDSSATLRGSLTDDGGESCSVRFQYGLTTSYGTTTSWVAGYVTGNTFTKAITGLSPGTTYHFRAQASNSMGTTSGSDGQFSTLPVEPNTFVATPGDTQVGLTWVKGDGATYTMIRSSTGGYPTTPTSGTQVYYNTGTSTTDVGLTNGIKVYYSAWSWANDVYSSTKDTDSATPTAPDPPDCTTNAATNVGATSARLNMYLDSLNGAASANVSFQYYKAGDPEWGDSTSATTYYVPGTHYVDLAGLDAVTVYYFRARAVSVYGTGYGTSLNFTTGGYSAPTITTQVATGVMRTAATINGKVTSDGLDPSGCTVWFQWGISATSLDQSTESGSGFITDDLFYYGLTGLTSSTLYYFRAVGQNPEGLAYGSVLNFTTTTASAPTARTDNAVPGANQAVLYGTVLTDGAATCQVRFQWGLTASYGYNTSWLSGYEAGQSFNQLIIGLEIATVYHYRAQVQNEGGLASGSDGNFTTVFTAPTDFRAKAISGTTINMEWLKGGDQTLVRYKEGSYPIDRSDGIQCYFGAGTSASTANLEAGTSYYFRAWSWREGNVWSSTYAEDMATTLSGALPVVEPVIIPPTPVTPSRWFGMPTGLGLANMPLYDSALAFADSIELPHGSFWLIIGNLLVLVLGALGWYVTKKPIIGLALGAFVAVVCGFLTMLPLFVMAIYIAFAGGIIYASSRG